jgi:hypothetical protein
MGATVEPYSEAAMKPVHMGILAGIAGAAVAWWFRNRQSAMALESRGEERGEVIFSNAPIV